MINSPEERALYTDWSQRWEEYSDHRGEDGRAVEEANGLFAGNVLDSGNKQMIKVGNDADAILEKDIELNNVGAESGYAVGGRDFIRPCL